MGDSDHYEHGSWNFLCDECGFKTKASRARKRWDGAIVCSRSGCWESRHPQDFVRGIADDQGVPFSRDGDNPFVEDHPGVTTTVITVPDESGRPGVTVTIGKITADLL